MSALADERLMRLLGGDRFVALRKRLRLRYERAATDGLVVSFRIDRLAQHEHAALAALQGRRQGFASSMTIDVRAIDVALRQAGIADSLHDALQRLDGPIVHLASERCRARNQWEGVANGCGHPALAALLRRPAGLGLLKRLSRQDASMATRVRRRAEAVLACLPANGMTRAQLAAQALGDAHGLDNGEATATLVLAVWRNVLANTLPRAEEPPTDGVEDSSPDISRERTRDIWARAGVLVNELARPAMFLNLPVWGLERCAPPGEPGYISLRRLLRAPPAWDVVDRTVHVCENPNLLAIAADRLGPDCGPLVSTDGMPAAAQDRLLTQLMQAGSRLKYHGDFDWPGLSIANHVMRTYAAHPWRFGACDYLAAVSATDRPPHLLKGREVMASWDETLTLAMRAHRQSVAEEGLADSLMQDLALRQIR